MTKKIFPSIMLVFLLLAFMPATGKAEAWAGCGSAYTVQWGDTLSGIAVRCGTTMNALRQANPGVYSWVYAGQVLSMPGYAPAPGGGAFTYVVARGDTLKMIAARYGTSMYAIASLNGLYNYDLIYTGQVLSIPGSGSYIPPALPPAPAYSGSTYIVKRGDTLRILANRWGVNIFDILAANPQITNSNIIFAGQVINIPGSSSGSSTSPSYYTVQRGDTLRIIANRYGTTVYNLLLLNPQIWNANLIYRGMVIRVQ